MHSSPVKFLIMVDAGGAMVARLFDANRVHVIDMDASTEEVVDTIEGIAPVHGATGPEWDLALAGHTASERAQAQVYMLAV
ncbi:MAG: hypothetical protein A3F78_16845 [Burkholderiales bacterium RIFCSPLOWO2_12_FULL_61_40]|nr:MAG: hypothetical protein A3F78_16845 [Burkholderiales bacterium RIFCSPLOWO2_12_FULL_61_40]